MTENIKLQGVRLSFPNIFEHEVFKKESTGKYSATFLIPKSDTETIQKINDAIDAAKNKAGVKSLPATARVCFKDGDETDREELQGHWSLKATTKKRPTVIHSKANGSENLAKEDEVIYPGCYVNAIIDGDFYCYTDYSKGVSSTLLGVQFYSDGETFEGGKSADIEDFDDFEDEL